MAKTQTINYGNATAIASTGVYQALWPDRPYTRKAAWVKNNSGPGGNPMSIKAPSGSIYILDPGATIQYPTPQMLEDGAYEITGTALDTFSFWESY